MRQYINDYLIVGEKETLEKLQSAMIVAESASAEDDEKSYMKTLFAELGLTQGVKKLLLKGQDIDWGATWSVRTPIEEFDDGRLKCYLFSITEMTESSETNNLYYIKRHINGIGNITFRKCCAYDDCQTNNTSEFSEKYYVAGDDLDAKGITDHYFEDEDEVIETVKSAFDIPEDIQLLSQLKEWCQSNEIRCSINEIEQVYSFSFSDYNYGLAVKRMLADVKVADKQEAIDNLYCKIHNDITCCATLTQGTHLGRKVRYDSPAIMFAYPIDTQVLSKYILEFGCPEVKDKYFIGYPGETNNSDSSSEKNGQELFLDFLHTKDIDTLRLSAQAGYLFAIKKLAEKLRYGGEADEEEEAVEWLVKAAEMGDAESQYKLAREYFENGKVEEEDLDYVLSLLRSSAESGCLDAVKKLYQSESDFNLSEDEYVKWLGKAVELGDDDALQQYAEYKFSTGEYDCALDLFLRYQKISEKQWNQPYTNKHVGMMYYKGLGTDVDYEKAAYFFNQNWAEYQIYLKQTNETIDANVWKDLMDSIYKQQLKSNLEDALMWNNWKKAVRIYRNLGECEDEALNELAWAFCETGNYEEALPLALKAVDLYPQAPVFDTLATAYQGVGRYEEAFSTFNLCLEKHLQDKNEDGITETKNKIDALKKLMNK